MKKIAFPLATWSFFALGGFITLLKALASGQDGRIATASAGLTIALGFVVLLLQLRKQRGATA